MTIEELDRALDLRPLRADVHPASLLHLRTLPRVVDDPSALMAEFDTPSPHPEGRAVLLSGSSPGWAHRVPHVTVVHDPFVERLNEVLPAGYEFLRSTMLCQSHLPEVIGRRAGSFECVVGVFVDGLSFTDAKSFPDCEPMLVDGPSSTSSGFCRLIGNPPLAAVMHRLGMRTRLGFSYWHRDDNDLANALFGGIADTRQVAGFMEIL